jgi:hypothetical protein
MRIVLTITVMAACLCMLFSSNAAFSGLIEAPQPDVSAQEKNTPFWRKQKTPEKLVNRYERRLPFFKKIDKNNDWKLVEAEISFYLLSRFKAFDANRDAEWDDQELDNMLSGFREELESLVDGGIERREKRLRIRIGQCDIDKNGIVTWVEYYNGMRQYYDLMDKNGDDMVEFIEFRSIDDKLAPISSRRKSQADVPAYK